MSSLWVTVLCIVAFVAYLVMFELIFQKISRLRNKNKSLQKMQEPEQVGTAISQRTGEITPSRADEIASYLRQQKEIGNSCSLAVRSASEKFVTTIDGIRILQSAARVGYLPIDLARAMVDKNYSLDQVVEQLRESYELSNTDIAKVIDALYPQEEEDRIGRILWPLNLREDVDDDLLSFLSQISSSQVLIATALAQNTDIPVVGVINMLNLWGNQEAVSEIVANTKTDLTSWEEYTALRDNCGFSFAKAAQILRTVGNVSLEGILLAEQEHEPFDFDDFQDRKKVIGELRSCKFSDPEILEAMIGYLGPSTPFGVLILAAIENEVSGEDVVKFLKANWDDTLESLWNEMGAAQIDTGDAVCIMYAYLPPEKRIFEKKDTVLSEQKSE